MARKWVWTVISLLGATDLGSVTSAPTTRRDPSRRAGTSTQSRSCSGVVGGAGFSAGGGSLAGGLESLAPRDSDQPPRASRQTVPTTAAVHFSFVTIMLLSTPSASRAALADTAPLTRAVPAYSSDALSADAV